MGVFTQIFDGTVGKILDVAKEPIKEWQVRKTIKAKGRIQVVKIKARTEIAKANNEHELALQGKVTQADWDQKAMDDSEKSYKDDIQFLVVIFPMVMCFFYPDKVLAGFAAMVKLPWWWKVAFLGMLARNFGLRWLVAPMMKRFGVGGKS
jgi:hypothetical protein